VFDDTSNHEDRQRRKRVAREHGLDTSDILSPTEVREDVEHKEDSSA